MKPSPSPLESPDAFRKALLDHYDACRRSLPWRDETDPYRILVSEVMLQQTRVETVLKYYGTWIEQFPDIESLAAADSDEVLRAWQGLGYYRRALNLHRTALMVRDRPSRSLPGGYAELRELPGIGEYTAGAVASIAFGEVVPAADGNVRRVLSRLFDVERPRPTWVRETAGALVDPDRPGDWNQALMDLGATVCVPHRPRCAACPVHRWCAARSEGTQQRTPLSGRRPAVRRVTMALAVLYDAGRVLLVRRPEGGLLGGMWAFPEREVAAPEAAAAAVSAVADAVGVGVRGSPEPLPVCQHRFTHLHATYVPFVLFVARGPATPDASWVPVRRPGRFAMPVAQRKVLRSVAAWTSGR